MDPDDPKPSGPESSVSGALDKLWLKFLPQIRERADLLEQAARALAQGNLSPRLCAEAHSAAHKLAGILGTFGLAEGTALAREAESICSPDSRIDPQSRQRFTAIASQLRQIVLTRR